MFIHIYIILTNIHICSCTLRAGVSLFLAMMVPKLQINNHCCQVDLIKGSLGVKLPTIWRHEKQRREEKSRREKEKELEERKKIQVRQMLGKSRNAVFPQ